MKEWKPKKRIKLCFQGRPMYELFTYVLEVKKKKKVSRKWKQ